jgi:hypothetical protein
MKLTIKALKTQSCPQCAEIGSLRQVVFGLLAKPLDEKRYISAGCTLNGDDPDLRCKACDWTGFRDHFPDGKTMDLQGRLIMTGVHEPGHSHVLRYEGSGHEERCHLICECGAKLEIESFRHSWSTMEVRYKYGSHLNEFSPGLGDKYLPGKKS